MNNKQKIIFDKEKQYKLDDVIYDVISYFDERGEELPTKLKRLLKKEVENIAKCGF